MTGAERHFLIWAKSTDAISVLTTLRRLFAKNRGE
jgi:hypothetical protein